MTEMIRDIEVVGVRGDPASTEVRSVEFDSRRVGPGSLFCCVTGAHTDGHLHAGEAVDHGAVALLCDRWLDLGVTQVQVAPGAVAPSMAKLASAFHGYPSRSLTMVGVTGTNGKTTVTHLVQSVLERADLPTGVIGTLSGARTTPESPVLQGQLADFRDAGCRAVAMEVSSHAMTQHRVDGIVFDVVAFTNLSRDHLDHHRTMEEYFEAKARLFEPSRARTAVINVDDPWGMRLAGLRGTRPTIPVRRTDAADIEVGAGSTSFRWRGRMVKLGLTGAFNVDNALLAGAVASELGVHEDQVVDGLEAATAVPGRMEVVSSGEPVTVVVDYAHTPAALEVALATARELAGPARVICLFGCGGDRDQGKRPEMGAVAANRAEVVVLTSDNPRSEDPQAIIDQIRSGTAGSTNVMEEPDRALAIGLAVDRADPGDVVLVAGKGHETTQTAGGRTWPFDDRSEARAALTRRFGGTAR